MKWVSPENVEAYIVDKPKWAQELLQRLREIIKTTIPQTEEGIKYTIPFYTYHGLFCFLSEKPEHVVLALCQGASLPDTFGIMTGNQKLIRHIEISPHDTFPEKEIRQMLIEAARFNEMRQQAKKMKPKKVKRDL